MGKRSRSARSGGANFAANSYRTEGIVLRTYKLAEADRIIVLLTPDHGQVRAVAKGIRRTSSKFGATLEPFMHTGVQIVRGRSLDIITQAVIIHPYTTIISSDYDSFGAASAMVETAERLTRDEDPQEVSQQFRLLYGALAALTKFKLSPQDIMNSYLLRALGTAGWEASFTRCAHCGLPGPHGSVNIRLGGAVCDECRPPGSLTPAPQTVDLLAAWLGGDWAAAQDPRILSAHHTEAHSIVEEYMQFHSEMSLHSLAVMEQRD